MSENNKPELNQPGVQGAPMRPVPQPDAVYPPGEDRRARKPRTWPAVVGTAAVTAVLVGGGTAVGTVAFLNAGDNGGSSAPIADVGGTRPITVTSVDEANWEKVASDVAPSVVAIDVRTRSGEAQGSGVVIDDAGHILTNDHVVSGAQDGAMRVTLSDGRLFEAKIVGLDPSTDLAVIELKDPPSDLVPATFADSDDVIVGNAVMAVGNPLGLANTVTTGIVSAVARPVSTVSEANSQDLVVTNAIQIDAAINPGNSGGPLFNSQGRVIGITSSIATMSQGVGQSGSIGLGFAIPSNLAKSVSGQLIEDGSAEHAFLGVGLSDGTATADGVTRRGAKVENVSADSPAAAAGIEVGDVVIAFDGKKVNGFESLTAYVRERVSGDRATVTVVRSGSVQDIAVTLAVKEDPATSGDSGGSPGQDQQDQQGPQEQGSGSSDPSGVPDDLFDWFFGPGN